MPCTNMLRTKKGQDWLLTLTRDLTSEAAQQVLAEVRATMPSSAGVSDEQLAEWVIETIMKLPEVCPDCNESELT